MNIPGTRAGVLHFSRGRGDVTHNSPTEIPNYPAKKKKQIKNKFNDFFPNCRLRFKSSNLSTETSLNISGTAWSSAGPRFYEAPYPAPKKKIDN